MPNIISFSFRYDRKSYMLLIFRRYYKGAFIRLLSAGGIISLILAFLYPLGVNPLQFTVFPFFGLMYGLLTLMIPLTIGWRTRKAFRQTDIFLHPVEVVIADDQITLASGDLRRNIRKEDIISKELMGKDILLLTGRESFLYIPGGQLDEAAFKALMNWLGP